MFRKDLIAVWLFVLALSGMFLLGQDAWVPPCSDRDGDGYGSPAGEACPYPEPDCDDENAEVNPAASEASYGDPVCADGLDNDCDGQADLMDNGCQECTSDEDCEDGNGCTDDVCEGFVCAYPFNSSPCSDSDTCTMNDVCTEGICLGQPRDYDGDGFVSDACDGTDCDDWNPEIRPDAIEVCNGIDENCDGTSDEGFEDLDGDGYASCDGAYDCNDSDADIHPGVLEGPMGDPTCSDGVDNDCDGSIDGDDAGCQCSVEGELDSATPYGCCPGLYKYYGNGICYDGSSGDRCSSSIQCQSGFCASGGDEAYCRRCGTCYPSGTITYPEYTCWCCSGSATYWPFSHVICD